MLKIKPKFCHPASADFFLWRRPQSATRIQSRQNPGPAQNSAIGGHQRSTAVDGGSHDEPVSRIAMQVFQLTGQQSNAAIKGYFDQTGPHPVITPASYRCGQYNTPALGQHCDLPETDGADGYLTGTPSDIDLPPCLCPQRWIVAIHPEQRVGVKNQDSAFQRSSSSGAITSPRISNSG